MRAITKLSVDRLRHQAGLSLIELMIAMVLGLTLMAGALQVFLGSKKSFMYNEETGSMQEGARYAMEFITRDARMAGYFGCGSQTIANTLNPYEDDEDAWAFNFNQGMVGYDGDDAAFPDDFPVAARPTLALGAALPKSDVFTILRGATENAAYTVASHNPTAAVIDIVGTHPFDSSRIMMISDCDHAAVFQFTGNNSQKFGHNAGGSENPGNCTRGLGLPVVCTANGTAYTYGGDAYVMEVLSHAYYVATAANNVPSIYRLEISGGIIDEKKEEELVQGVENMQAFYGVDGNGDGVADRYVIAAATIDWTTIVSLRLHILTRSLTEVTSEPVDFRFVGTTYTPTDKYLRKEFITTVKIRNRGV